MRIQRKMAQMKEQIKTPEKELNEMEISNQSDAEFKTLVIRMLRELSENLNNIKRCSQQQRIHKLKENFKHSKTHIIRVPEEEDKEQKVGHLFEKRMKENFPI